MTEPSKTICPDLFQQMKSRLPTKTWVSLARELNITDVQVSQWKGGQRPIGLNRLNELIQAWNEKSDAAERDSVSVRLAGAQVQIEWRPYAGWKTSESSG